MASRQLTVIIAGDARGARDAFREVEQGTDSLQAKLANAGQSMMRTGGFMTAGITLPLLLLGKTAFDAASDLNESLSKVNVVFGDNATEIKKWSKTAAESMGISRQEALESAGTFGNLFRALGVGIAPATDMSKKLVGLASDLASFNNADPTEVLEALRSGLVGEAEPLRKFGVSLSEARIQAKALEMGLWDGEGALTASGKAQAAYQIILDDTTLAQGDFALTADGAANKQKTLRAQFQDTAGKLGRVLIPIFQKVATVVQKVAAWFTNLDPKWQNLIVYVGIAAAVIGPLLVVFGALATAAAAVASPITLIVIAAAAVVAAIVLMYTKWDEIWTWMKDHPAILLVVSILAAPIAALFLLIGVVKLVAENWGVIWPRIQTVLQDAWSVIEPILAGADWVIRQIIVAAAWLGDRAGEYFGKFRDAVVDMWNVVDGPLGWLLGRLNDIVAAARIVKDALSDFRNPFSNPFGGSGDIEAVKRAMEGRASGGPVMGGTPYIVGEAGPELFVPGASGTIVPNHALGGGGGLTVVVQGLIHERQLDQVFAEAFARWQRHNGRR